MNIKNVKRGEIYYAELSPVVGSEQDGKRPTLIIQNNIGNKFSPTVLIAPITSRKKRDLPTHIRINKSCGLAENSIVMLEQIRVIDKCRLNEYIGILDDVQMQEVNNAISISFGIDKIGGQYGTEKKINIYK